MRSKIFALIIAASLHGATLVALLYSRPIETAIAPAAPAAPPLTVSLLPLAAPQRPTQKQDVAPQRLKSPRPVTPNPLEPLPRPKVGVDTERDIAPPSPAPRPAPAQTLETAVATASPPSAPAVDAPGNAKDSWEDRVLARLERFKRYPAAARSRRQQGVTTLRFRLDRQGRVLSSTLVRSSGSAVLDREAMATLARAEPFPAIPADRPAEIELVVPIDFALEPR